MKKIILIQLLAWMFCANISAQTVEDLKSNSDYLWGEGYAQNYNNAYNEALKNLVSQISYQVVIETKSHVNNKQEGSQINSSTEFDSKMSTYSTAKLANLQTMVLENGPKWYRIFLYASKADAFRIFTERQKKVDEFVQIGNKALEQRHINDALRYYYWASILNNSLPNPEETKIYDENEDSRNFGTWFPKQMNDIFNNLSMEVLSKNNNEYEMGFFYKKEPVASVEFTYFDGQTWSGVTRATDGKGLLEMRPTHAPDRIQVKFEYEFYHELDCDKEIKDIVNVVDDFNKNSSFSNSYKTTKLDKVIEQNSAEAVALKKVETQVINFETNSSEVTVNSCNKVMEEVIKAIRNKNFSSIKKYFTPEGDIIFNKLINYGSARIIGEPELSYTTVHGFTYCRSIPMSFSFGYNKKFVEDVVFVFNDKGLIDNVSFSLGKIATNDIIEGSPTWSVEAKNVLINFMEVYKTAYALERKDFLESIFADDALIITGKVVTVTKRKLDGTYETNKEVVRNKQTKEQFINNLKKMFDNNSFVNLKFANNQVLKMGKGQEIYSIQIRQDFVSSNYSDSGYLFIMVDLTKPHEPVIRVRTWQEFPDPDFGKFGPEMF